MELDRHGRAAEGAGDILGAVTGLGKVGKSQLVGNTPALSGSIRHRSILPATVKISPVGAREKGAAGRSEQRDRRSG